MSKKNEHKPGYKHTPLGWIPEEWSIKEFGKFASVSNTKYLPSIAEDKRCIELEHINQEVGSINGYISSANQKSTKNVFKKGQVLFGKLRPYLKKYWLADFDGVCSSEVWVLQSNSEDCCNEYLFRIVQQHRFIQAANVSSGSKMPRADWNFVAEFPFALPTSSERKKITAILSTWDEAITKTQQLIAQLQQRNKGLMQQLLTGKKRLEGFEKSKWHYQHLKDIGKIVSGLTYSPEDVQESGVLVLRSSNIQNSRLEFDDCVYVNSNVTYNQIQENDILICVRNGSRDLIGKNVLIPKEIEGVAFGTFMTVFRSVFNYYLIHLFDSDLYYKKVYKNLGATINSINGNDLYLFNFLMPEEEEEMKAIAKVLDAAANKVKLHEQKLAALQQQKKGLMQKLLTGEVRIKI